MFVLSGRAIGGSLRRSRRPNRLAAARHLQPLGVAVLGLLQLGWNVRHIVTARRLRAALRRTADDASAKSLFLRLASHEIRTPLALARGYLDIIGSEALGPVNVEI